MLGIIVVSGLSLVTVIQLLLRKFVQLARTGLTSFQIPRWITKLLIPLALFPALLIFSSLSMWGAALPAYVLLKLSETERLRNEIFWGGVLAFLASKAIEYSLVH